MVDSLRWKTNSPTPQKIYAYIISQFEEWSFLYYLAIQITILSNFIIHWGEEEWESSKFQKKNLFWPENTRIGVGELVLISNNGWWARWNLKSILTSRQRLKKFEYMFLEITEWDWWAHWFWAFQIVLGDPSYMLIFQIGRAKMLAEGLLHILWAGWCSGCSTYIRFQYDLTTPVPWCEASQPYNWHNLLLTRLSPVWR